MSVGEAVACCSQSVRLTRRCDLPLTTTDYVSACLRLLLRTFDRDGDDRREVGRQLDIALVEEYRAQPVVSVLLVDELQAADALAAALLVDDGYAEDGARAVAALAVPLPKSIMYSYVCARACASASASARARAYTCACACTCA